MKRTIGQIWSELPQERPASDLISHILRRIALARRRRAYVRGTFAGSMALASVIAFAYGVKYVIDELYLSGFMDYVQLLLSNSSLAGNFWKPLALSLVESLPLTSLAILLAIAAVAGWSLIRAVRTFTEARHVSLAA